MPLQLTLPAPRQAGPLSAEPLTQLLAGLPLANASEAARQLSLLFERALAPGLPLSTRLLHFASLQDTEQRLRLLLQNELQRRELSATLRAREAAYQTRALVLGKLALIKCCLQQAAAESPDTAQHHALLQSTLGTALDALHVHIESYHPLPAGFWLDCHRIYQHAQQHHAEDTLAADYKCLLLLGEVDHQRLSGAQIARLLRLAGDEAPQLTLTPTASTPLADHPAGGARLARPLLIERLRLQLTQLAHSAHEDALEEAELIQLLLHDLQRLSTQRPPRQAGGGTVELISTLAACWYALNGRSWQFPPPEQQEEVLEFCLRLHKRSAPPPALTLDVVNTSPCGMQLVGQAQGLPLRAGEFVLVRDAGGDWQGALIRWVSYGDGLQTRCGVELIAKQLCALIAYGDDKVNGIAVQLALGVDAPGPNPPLLLAGRPFKRLARVHLLRRNRHHSVHLLRVERQTPLYQLIACRPG